MSNSSASDCTIIFLRKCPNQFNNFLQFVHKINADHTVKQILLYYLAVKIKYLLNHTRFCSAYRFGQFTIQLLSQIGYRKINISSLSWDIIFYNKTYRRNYVTEKTFSLNLIVSSTFLLRKFDSTVSPIVFSLNKQSIINDTNVAPYLLHNLFYSLPLYVQLDSPPRLLIFSVLGL